LTTFSPTLVSSDYTSLFKSLTSIESLPPRFLTHSLIQSMIAGPKTTNDFEIRAAPQLNLLKSELVYNQINLCNFEYVSKFDCENVIVPLHKLIIAIEKRARYGRFDWRLSLAESLRYLNSNA
ncbi:hypothetical protein PFISCL1PPCAC_29235, partial [Pristionchus fissidentatus]